MDSINLNNSSCQEIPKIRKIYWQWYDNFVSVNPIKRYNEWRIKNIELASLEVFKQFTFDVTEWTLDEPVSQTENGPIVSKVISGFNPKFNEIVESYVNEMTRRPVIICYETFDGKVYLFGGKNPKSRFTFKKSITSRQGYTVEFTNNSDESSLVIDDTDHFPSPGILTGVTQITINGEDFATVPCGNTFDVIVKNEDDEQIGSIVLDEWIVPSAEPPVGILFKWPLNMQYSSYRTGDEGYRIQNSLLLPADVPNPELIPELDYSIGSNYWFQLKSALKVGANSNTLRFVDVDGLQVWGATNNKDKIVIDKLTGLGIIRDWRNVVTGMSGKNWNDSIDLANSFSITVDGITYSDWYLPTINDCLALFGSVLDRSSTYFKDPITNADIIYITGWQSTWTSTTVPSNTSNAIVFEAPTQYMRINTGFAKTQTGFASSFIIFDARNLISKP